MKLKRGGERDALTDLVNYIVYSILKLKNLAAERFQNIKYWPRCIWQLTALAIHRYSSLKPTQSNVTEIILLWGTESWLSLAFMLFLPTQILYVDEMVAKINLHIQNGYASEKEKTKKKRQASRLCMCLCVRPKLNLSSSSFFFVSEISTLPHPSFFSLQSCVHTYIRSILRIYAISTTAAAEAAAIPSCVSICSILLILHHVISLLDQSLAGTLSFFSLGLASPFSSILHLSYFFPTSLLFPPSFPSRKETLSESEPATTAGRQKTQVIATYNSVYWRTYVYIKRNGEAAVVLREAIWSQKHPFSFQLYVSFFPRSQKAFFVLLQLFLSIPAFCPFSSTSHAGLTLCTYHIHAASNVLQ